jgi:single-strand DNA-binding protein
MNSISFVGNLLADPELKFTDGKPRAIFRVAVNEGQGDQEKMHPIDVTAFGTLAENLAESLKRGMRVVVVGRFNSYKSEVEIKGEEKTITRLSVTASAVGPDLRWATAKVSKVSRDSGQGNDGGEGSGEGSRGGSGRGSDSGNSSSGRSSNRSSGSSSRRNDGDDF